jgi:hypothetical protein
MYSLIMPMLEHTMYNLLPLHVSAGSTQVRLYMYIVFL